MRLIPYASMAALAAFVCRAPSDDLGGGGGDAAAAGAATSKPEAAKPEPAAPKTKKVHVVWAQPGHGSYAVGMMVRTAPDVAEALRAAGHARPADVAEVRAAADSGRPIVDFG